MDKPTLFSPLHVRDVEFRNRVWVSPLCEYSCEGQDGVVGDWHLVHLGSFARGGAGLVMAEATGVSPEARISPWCPGLWNADHVAAWQRVTSFITSMGAQPGIQLQHAGRKASAYREWSGSGTVPLSEGGWQSVAPSAVPFPGYDTPLALNAAGIADVVADFARSARLALEAGFTVIEIHAAHGYLLHQFLSPLSNTRDDEWGGSLENRARLVLDIVRAVRAEVGEAIPVFVRLSATDWIEPEGWTLSDSVTLAQWIKEAGGDVLDTSTGGLIPGVRIPSAPGYQVPQASAIKDGSGIVTTAVGQITEAQQANELITAGSVDAVFVGRQFMRDPHLPLRWAHELGIDVDYWPVQYLRARWA